MSFVSLAAATQTRIASEPVIANKKWPLHNRALKKCPLVSLSEVFAGYLTV